MMKDGTILKGLFRGLTIVMASVMTLGIGMTIGAKLNESDINSYLGTSNRVVIQDEEGTYLSDYDSWQEMVDAKAEGIYTTMSEGIVLLKNNGVLPMEGVTKINLFGRNSADPVYGGGGGAGVVSDPNALTSRRRSTRRASRSTTRCTTTTAAVKRERSAAGSPTSIPPAK